MDTITYFIHYLGRINDIEEGNFENMQSINSLEEIKTAEILNDALNPSKSIMIPHFIGVYQDLKVKADTFQEAEHIKDIERGVKNIEKQINEIIKASNEFMGRKERFTPSLMHICYDQNIYNKRLVRDIFGEGSERLGFSPYSAYPNFRDKNTALGIIYIEKLNKSFEELKGESMIPHIIKIAEKAYDDMRGQLIKFGLTREESAFLDSMGRLKANSMRNIIDSIPSRLVRPTNRYRE